MWGAVRSPFRLNLMLLGAFKTSFFLFRSLPLVGATMAPRRRGGIGCRRPQRRPRWWWRRCLLQRHVYGSTTFSRQRLAVRSLPQLQNARHPWAIYSSLPQPDPCLYVRPARLLLCQENRSHCVWLTAPHTHRLSSSFVHAFLNMQCLQKHTYNFLTGSRWFAEIGDYLYELAAYWRSLTLPRDPFCCNNSELHALDIFTDE